MTDVSGFNGKIKRGRAKKAKGSGIWRSLPGIPPVTKVAFNPQRYMGTSDQLREWARAK